jgi:uncharacterized protein (DUF58 family)
MRPSTHSLIRAIRARMPRCALALGGGSLASGRLRRRGSGLDFESLRPYTYGDEVRHIDWKATARLQRPYVRQYADLHEQVLTFVVDISASMGQVDPQAPVWGGQGLLGSAKRLHAAYWAGMGIALALARGHRVALALVTHDLQYYLPAQHTPYTLERCLQALLEFQPLSRHTHLAPALAQVNTLLEGPGCVTLVSDLRGACPRDPILRGLLALWGKQHQAVAIVAQDAQDGPWPKDLVGHCQLADAETGQLCSVYVDPAWLAAQHAQAQLRHRQWQALLGAAGFQTLSLNTTQSVFATERQWLGLAQPLCQPKTPLATNPPTSPSTNPCRLPPVERTRQ